MTIFFTSDSHFGHKKMVQHRGFDSVETMDHILVKTWNSRVQPQDTVYHLGDLSFHGADDTVSALRQLNGQIKLVPGNHDNSKVLKAIVAHAHNVEVLPSLVDIKFVQHVQGQSEVHRMVLCHFPMLQWNRRHYGVIHLHGHSHGSCVYPGAPGRIMDVGVDCHGMGPISLPDVLAQLLPRPVTSSDHHRVSDYNKSVTTD